MPQVRDLFFEEFYEEFERVIRSLKGVEEGAHLPKLSKEVADRWINYVFKPPENDATLISVDGGVQFSDFAYGGFIATGRGCALINAQGRGQRMARRVKIYVGEVFDDRDRHNIPSYLRSITEYEAAKDASERVIEEGGKPLVLMDGSLYFSRFPYAIHDYQHHPTLMAELFEAVSSLYRLSVDEGFPLLAVSKDSTVFYLNMELLKEAALRAGLKKIIPLLEEASSPYDLRLRMVDWKPEDREAIEPFLDAKPLCDISLIEHSVSKTGFSIPLLLAPSIYYGGEDIPAFYSRIKRVVGGVLADRVISALNAFFSTPGIMVTYFKPTLDARPLRVDLAASTLGLKEKCRSRKERAFIDERLSLDALTRILDHLGYWFCNEVEYNLPLHQADKVARFDRDLYKSVYEPYMIERLKEAGLDTVGRRRVLREVEP